MNVSTLLKNKSDEPDIMMLLLFQNRILESRLRVYEMP